MSRSAARSASASRAACPFPAAAQDVDALHQDFGIFQQIAAYLVPELLTFSVGHLRQIEGLKRQGDPYHSGQNYQ